MLGFLKTLYRILRIQKSRVYFSVDHEGKKKKKKVNAHLLFKRSSVWLMGAFLFQQQTLWTESWQRWSDGVIVSLLCLKQPHPSGCPTENVYNAGMRTGLDDDDDGESERRNCCLSLCTVWTAGLSCITMIFHCTQRQRWRNQIRWVLNQPFRVRKHW